MPIRPNPLALIAVGEEGEPGAREALMKAAIAVDRAKARLLRNRSDGDALAAWRALIEGRWSLIERFESGGRRFLLARRNEPGNVPVPLLDEREQAVLGYRAAGHALKIIAYEMGYTVGHLSRVARSAMDKLGLHSPADLAAFFSKARRSGKMRAPRASPGTR